MNEPSFDFIKTGIFNFPFCKIYLGTWARKARRARRYVGHVGHVGTLGMPFSRFSMPSKKRKRKELLKIGPSKVQKKSKFWQKKVKKKKAAEK